MVRKSNQNKSNNNVGKCSKLMGSTSLLWNPVVGGSSVKELITYQ